MYDSHHADSNFSTVTASGSSSSGSSHHDKTPPLPKLEKEPKPSAVSQLLSLRLASKRPLPTEYGDGSYRTVDKRPGWRNDLKTIRLKGDRINKTPH